MWLVGKLLACTSALIDSTYDTNKSGKLELSS